MPEGPHVWQIRGSATVEDEAVRLPEIDETPEVGRPVGRQRDGLHSPAVGPRTTREAGAFLDGGWPFAELDV